MGFRNEKEKLEEYGLVPKDTMKAQNLTYI